MRCGFTGSTPNMLNPAAAVISGTVSRLHSLSVAEPFLNVYVHNWSGLLQSHTPARTSGCGPVGAIDTRMWHGGLAVAGQVPRGVPRGFATILVVDRTPVGTPSTPFVGSAVVPRLAIMYWFDPDWAMTSARPVLSLLHVGLLTTSVMFLKPGSPTIRLNDEATTRVVSATTSKTSPPTPWFHITVEPPALPV